LGRVLGGSEPLLDSSICQACVFSSFEYGIAKGAVA
jgi:hypothetical protein